MQASNHFPCIYQIKNLLNGKLYIGQTKDYQTRVKSHLYFLNNGISDCKKLQYAFNKYGEDAFEFSVIERCSEKELDEKEIFWITKLNTVDDGYNLCYGGGGLRGYKQSKLAVQKRAVLHSIPIVCLNTGEVFQNADAAIEKYNLKSISSIRSCCNGNKKSAGKDQYGERLVWMDYSDEYLNMPTEEILYLVWAANQSGRGIFNHNYGKHITEEQKEKYRATRKATIEKYGNPNRKKKRPEIAGTNSYRAHAVVCVNTGEYFDLINDAANTYNISQSSISACISGRINSAGKDDCGNSLLWIDANKYNSMSQDDIEQFIQAHSAVKSYCRQVLCVNTGELFNSVADAARAYSIDQSCIIATCKGRQKTAGNNPRTNERLQWKYA